MKCFHKPLLTATVAEAQFLVANDPALIPLTPGQARTWCLTYLRALLLLTLGLFHPWTVGLGTFLQEHAAREVELETVHQVRDVPYSAMVPALIVRFVQLRWSRWLLRQWNSPVHIPVPDLIDLFTQIELEVAWEPTFPMQYPPLL
jgi:hypothetical protein